MPTSPTVFISYRRKSSVDLAQALHGRLKDAGVDVFFDLDAIGGGEDYELRLEAELDQRDCLLVILAPETLEQSAWVRREIAAVLRRHKKIIPVTTGGYTFTRDTLPPEIADLARYNYIVYEPRYTNAAFDEIKRALGITDNLTASPASGVGTRHVSAASPKPTTRSGMSNTTITAIITGIFAVIVALIGIVPNLLPKVTETPTLPPTTQAVAAVPTSTLPPPIDTLIPPTSTDAPTLTLLPPTPTATAVPPTPTSTPTPTNTALPPTPASTSGLVVGEQAVIAPNPDGYLNLRSAVGRDNPVLVQVPVGSAVLVLDGPTYAEDMLWWKLRAPNGVIGWTVEAGDNRQLLMPFMASVTAIPAPPTPALTLTPTTTIVGASPYPCNAQIVSSSATTLNVIRSSPSNISPLRPPLQPGIFIVIHAKELNQGKNWYQIWDTNGLYLGWLTDQYIVFSPLCSN